MTPSSTAVAHPNIALIKYWGKRDDRLILPATSSLSLTLDVHPTTTTVALAEADSASLDGAPMTGDALERVVRFLDLVRELAGSEARASVVSTNAGPTAAGLASSASGFAALAAAAAHAYGLDLDERALSRLARRGSGSASRSIYPGFAQWHAGSDDESSFAEPVEAPGIDAAMVVAVVDGGPKHVSSRAAMRETVRTSPFFAAWIDSSAVDLADLRAALAAGDLPAVGDVAERNAMRMHATMLGAEPPVRYLSPASVAVLDRVRQLRAEGVGAWATMDAGPNVKVLTDRADAERVRAAVAELGVTSSLLVAGSGPGVAVREGAVA